MRFRILQIAWSVVFGVVFVLLIALWVRSYWWADLINVQYQWPCIISRGDIFYHVNLAWTSTSKRYFELHPLPGLELEVEDFWAPNASNVDVISYKMRIPIWSIAIVSAVATAVPWLPWRFSLRTLLIATTLVAIALGLLMYVLNSRG